MPRALQPRPLYREILRDAFLLAWKEKRFWPLALLTVFLQTAGIYDVFFLSVRGALQSPVASDQGWQTYVTQVSRLNLLEKFALSQSILLSLAIIFLILFFSVIAQGTLVACLDRVQQTNGRGGFRQALQAAARRVVPLAVLNLLMVGIASLGSFALQSLAGALPNLPFGPAWFVLAAIIYLIVLFVATSLHLFALNGVMADGMTLHEALEHAMSLLRKTWITVAETAFCMMIIGACMFIAAMLLSFFAGLPAIGFLFASLYLGLPKIFVFANIAISAIVFLAAIIAGLFAVNFQYATWNRLYRRAMEGTAHSKIIRVVHALTTRRARSSTAR